MIDNYPSRCGEDDKDNQEDDTATEVVTAKTIHNNKCHSKGRVQQLVIALALCVAGVVHHLKHLPYLPSSSSSSSFNPPGQHHLILPDLFVPSMDFTILSQTTPGKNHDRPPGDEIWDCTKQAKDLQWEWYNLPSSSSSSTNTTTTGTTKHQQSTQKPRLLIGLSSGYDKYAEMLALSAHLAKVYAHTHNATVVVLQGTALAPDGCTGPAWYTTVNKIRLLFAAIDRRDQYDQILLLEADTLMVNMDFDIPTLLSSPSSSSQDLLIAAQPIRQGDSPTLPERHQIHAGITLWNLHHEQCKIVALQWFEEARKAVMKGSYSGDQRFLQGVLQRQDKDIIQWLDKNDEFAYEDGTVVKHFFSHSSSWSDRKRRMEQVAKSVCEKYDCTVVPRIDYDSIP